MHLKIKEMGNPSAFWTEHCPTDEEVNERTIESGDYESAAETVYSRREPGECDGDTDAVLEDVDTGEAIHYDYRDGECYSERGARLPPEFAAAAHEAGVPEGSAIDDEELKELIANTEPLIGSPENVTLINREVASDD